MKTLISTVCAAALALGAVAPLNAAPLQLSQPFTQAPAEVIQAQISRNAEEFGYDRLERREWRRERREDRRDFRRAVRRGDHWYYNGYRGYRHHQPGYRRHGDFWFPLAAFAAGAIISGALNQPRVIYRSGGGSAHVEWCYDRYRSYRAYDNTFQPYEGPRRQCYSPYS